MNDSTPSVAEWREQQLRDRAGQTGLNAYTCKRCGKRTVTIDVDPGVTPMFLTCRATDGCRGEAVSMMYPPGPPPGWLLSLLRWEWRIPSDDEFRGLSNAMKDHVARGGLDLQPYSGRPSAYDPTFPDEVTRRLRAAA